MRHMLVQRLAEAGHVAVTEDAQSGGDEPMAVAVGHRVLAGQVRDDGLGNREPHSVRGSALHESISLSLCG